MINPERIDALLATQCMTYAEIGRRVGLSRERIRQIDLKKHGRKGMERKRACILPGPTVPKRAFIQACEDRGLEVSASMKRNGYSARLSFVVINGWLCKMLKAVLSSNYGYPQYCIAPVRSKADVYVYELSEGEFLIVPLGNEPVVKTGFCVNRLRKNRRTECRDWHSYRDAWHFLSIPKMP